MRPGAQLQSKTEELATIASAWEAGEDVQERLVSLVDAHSNWGRAHLALSLYYASVGRDEEALEAAKKATASESAAEAWSAIGSLKRHTDDAEAIAAFKRAWELEHDAQTALNIADLLVRTGFPPAATTWFEKAIEADPEYPEAHFNFGLHCLVEDRLEEGIEHLLRAVELDAGYARAWAELGAALAAADRHEDALHALDHALKIDRKDFWAHVHRANVHWALGDERKASRDFRAAIKAEPDLAEPHVFFGEFLALTGKTVAAEKQFEEAMAIDPNPAVRKKFAEYLRAWGETARAEALTRI